MKTNYASSVLLWVFWTAHCVKCVHIRSFSGPYFPAFGLHTKRYEVSLPYSVQMQEYTTRKTPNTDTFHAVAVHQRSIITIWIG